MKRILSLIAAAALVAVTGCQRYELNTDFTQPTELESPAEVTLDVTSSSTVVLSWTGGQAADGGILLYNVLFDLPGGDFSNPLATMQSDLGARSTLTLTHAQLNSLARKAGIKPNEKGSLIWTVTTSKGGVTEMFDGYSELKLVRGEGIDNIPEHLYVAGTAAKEAGQEFRAEDEGVFVIYTEIGEGSLKFTSEKNGGNAFYADENAKLNEGDGEFDVTAAPESGLARLTVNFNTLSFTVEEVSKSVRAIWAATYTDIAVLEYAGNGNFTGDGDVVFLGPGREGTPDWCSWVEERYYFIATVDGTEVCWGSNYGSAVTPDGTEEFYYVNEFSWDQWNHLWKMDHAYDECHVTFTIETNNNNHMTHSYQGGAITYDQPSETPAELYFGGSAAETEGQAMRKDGDKFIIYNKLSDGNISLTDGNGTKYFAKGDNNDLYIGSPKTTASASAEGCITRVTVDFSTKKVSYESVSSTLRLAWAATTATVISLDYQGLGKYAGEGDIIFLGPGRDGTPSWCSWAEERYYFLVGIDGTDMCWGRLDGVSGERPDGEVSADFYNLGEFSWSEDTKWNHAWKMASNLDESSVTASVNTNDMTHSFVKASVDPVTPTVAPSSLTLKGTGVEAEAEFRKISDGVFEAVTKLSEGEMHFTSGSKNYFAGSGDALLQGDGNTVTAASDCLAERITVDFVNCTVKVEKITQLVAIWGCNEQTFMTFAYEGKGIFKASGAIDFIDPGDPQYNMATWLTWTEERYRYIVTIDGADKCWGRLDEADAENRPDNPDTVNANFWQIGEFAVGSQWDHLWKFASNLDGSNVEIVINTNDNGVMTQTITKK